MTTTTAAPAPAGIAPRAPRGPVPALRRTSVALRRDEARLIGIVLIVVLVGLVLAPAVLLFLSAVRVQFTDSAALGHPTGAFTSHYLWEVFVSPISRIYFWQPLEHTMTTSLGACALALLLGGALAWCVTRLEFPGRRLLAPALLLPYIVPSWAVAQAWLSTFHNASMGGSPGVLEGLGFEPPTWLAAGELPIIAVLGTHLSVFVYLLASAGLQGIGAELEEAGLVLGGSRRHVIRRVSVPLLFPALASAGVLVFAQVLGDFATPYLLGLPVHFNTLATSLRANIETAQDGVVAVIASTVVVLGTVAVVIEGFLSRHNTRFAALRQTAPPTRLGATSRWRRLGATAFVGSIVTLGAGLPLFILLVSTVTKIPGRLVASNFTLGFWTANNLVGFPDFPHGLLRGGALYSAAWNSIRIMGIAAIVCGLVGFLVGYVVSRSRSRVVSGAVRQLSFFPYLIPGVSLAAAYILTFAVHRGPIPALYGGIGLLVIAMVVIHLPYSSRAAIAAFAQSGRSPEEAARIQGASFPRALLRIVLPMQLRALVTGITLAFISGLKEVNVVIMLTVSSAGLLTTLAINLAGEGYNQLANGVTFVIVVLSVGGYLLLRRLFKLDVTASIGGGSATGHTR